MNPCCSCGLPPATVFFLEGRTLCEICVDIIFRLKSLGFLPEDFGWKVTPPPEIFARAGGVGNLRRACVLPVLERPIENNQGGLVLLVGAQTPFAEAVVSRCSSTRKYSIFCHPRFVLASLRRFRRAVPTPIVSNHRVANGPVDPVIAADYNRSRIAKRRLMPCRVREGCLVIALPLGSEPRPTSVEEMLGITGASRAVFRYISDIEFDEALRTIPWGEPLRFQESWPPKACTPPVP